MPAFTYTARSYGWYSVRAKARLVGFTKKVGATWTIKFSDQTVPGFSTRAHAAHYAFTESKGA